MIRTYLDTGVLIAAQAGDVRHRPQALEWLTAADRHLIGSDYLRLELLPKARYHRQHEELRFYEQVFDGFETWIPDSKALFDDAVDLAGEHGLAAMDALHLAAAKAAGAEEFLTLERPGKPMFRLHAEDFRILTLYDAPAP